QLGGESHCKTAIRPYPKSIYHSSPKPFSPLVIASPNPRFLPPPSQPFCTIRPRVSSSRRKNQKAASSSCRRPLHQSLASSKRNQTLKSPTMSITTTAEKYCTHSFPSTFTQSPVSCPALAPIDVAV
ncbi:unnamed protein product, partial [Linum tenue]